MQVSAGRSGGQSAQVQPSPAQLAVVTEEELPQSGGLPLGDFQHDICSPVVPERMVLTLKKTFVGLS